MALRPAKADDPFAAIDAIESIECGKEAAKHFLFEQGWRNLNHGSFGTYPIEIRSVMRYFQDLSEVRPDRHIRYDYPRFNDEAREAIARLLDAPSETVVFVPNATTGVNVVLRNLVYEPGDVIVYFSTIYGSCHKTIEHLAETTPVQGHGIEYTCPCTDDFLCSAFESAIQTLKAQGKKPRLAVFDTIVSLPGVRMPFERLTRLCREANILSVIDGAHSAGQITLSLSTLDPDFYVSNCHKWLFVPRGCAVLHVPLRNQALMRSSLPTSHGFIPRAGNAIPNPLPPSQKSEFVNQFEFVGTIDNAPYLCVPAALRWRSKVTFSAQGLRGEEAISRYCEDLACDGGRLVAEALGTEVMDNEAQTLTKCAFANVRLPVTAAPDTDTATKIRVAQWISKTIVDEYDTFMAFIVHDEKFWVRLSAQIYLTMEDFEWAGGVLKSLCERASKAEWLVSK